MGKKPTEVREHEEAQASLVTVGMSENNSGGFYHLTGEDYQALADAGWEVSNDGHWDRHATLRNTTLEDARASFEQATGWDADACYCDCCGGNFWFTEDPWWI